MMSDPKINNKVGIVRKVGSSSKSPRFISSKKETDKLVLNNEILKEIMRKMEERFAEGLSDEAKAIVKMFITYVREVPTGLEKGDFLALDLGGTNFRVLLITLEGGSEAKIDSDIYEIPKEMMLGEGAQLFNYIADCLFNFVKKRKLKSKRIPLGFTFSFPCYQSGLASAKLVRWTKGFKCANVEGKDVGKMLRDAIRQKQGEIDVFIDVLAVINDTVGTLMSCAHKNQKCCIGLIVGTGSNACYIEHLDNIPKWGRKVENPKQMIINCESGAFGEGGDLKFIETEFDRQVDEASLNPGKQIFEKMISGMYMGERFRLVLNILIKKQLLFPGIKQLPEMLTKKYELHTKYVSKVDTDREEDDFKELKEFMKKHFDGVKYDQTDLAIIQMVSERISTRAADLTAALLAALTLRMKRKDIVVGYDGSLIKLHPTFKKKVEERMAELVGDPSYKFELMVSEDGSGRGAALVSAVAAIQTRSENKEIF